MKVYLLQINYKSGISMQAEFKKFYFNGSRFEWELYGSSSGPILLGADEVESVWQLSVREVGEVTE
jgi:hypothetical protein